MYEPTPARLDSNHLAFILAGNAIFTIRIDEGERITYRVRQPSPDKPHFVSVLFGPDNSRDYKFIGTIFDGKTFRINKKPGAFSADTVSVQLFEIVFSDLVDGVIAPDVEIWHAGRCGRCGKLLTDPYSIESGIGPICAAKMDKSLRIE
ncbi:MAG: DUF6011 domain-containing protein [Thermoanaerobaculia bacterium]